MGHITFVVWPYFFVSTLLLGECFEKWYSMTRRDESCRMKLRRNSRTICFGSCLRKFAIKKFLAARTGRLFFLPCIIITAYTLAYVLIVMQLSKSGFVCKIVCKIGVEYRSTK